MALTLPPFGPWVVHTAPLAMLDETRTMQQHTAASIRRGRGDPIFMHPSSRACPIQASSADDPSDERGVFVPPPGDATFRVAARYPGGRPASRGHDLKPSSLHQAG